MKKTLKLIGLALATFGCISISVIAFIGMLCYYREPQALPWAAGAAATFMVAVWLSFKMDELTQKTK